MCSLSCCGRQKHRRGDLFSGTPVGIRIVDIISSCQGKEDVTEEI